jgi:hypothetical protein
LNYWTYQTNAGVFSIIERTSRGVDLYFEQIHLGHYRSPVDAAEQAGRGDHPPLECAPDDGKSLKLPTAVHEWKFMRKP